MRDFMRGDYDDYPFEEDTLVNIFDHWFSSLNYRMKHEFLETYGLEDELENFTDMAENEEGVYKHLPKDWVARMPKDVKMSYLAFNSGAADEQYYTRSAMELGNNQLLKRDTWLVHFTDEPYGIAAHGFKYGAEDMEQLALTTHFRHRRKAAGYNFALIADSRDAKKVASTGKYGKEFVLFQNSGTDTYHWGDDERQIVFWGEDVHPNGIIPVYKEDDEYVIKDSQTDRVIYRSEKYIDIVQWVKTNIHQYRNRVYVK